MKSLLQRLFLRPSTTPGARTGAAALKLALAAASARAHAVWPDLSDSLDRAVSFRRRDGQYRPHAG